MVPLAWVSLQEVKTMMIKFIIMMAVMMMMS